MRRGTLGELLGKDVVDKLKSQLNETQRCSSSDPPVRATDPFREAVTTWRRSGERVPIQKRVRKTGAIPSAARKSAPVASPKPLPLEALERAKAEARSRANAIATKRAHLAAEKASWNGPSHGARRESYNSEFQRVHQKVLAEEQERLLPHCCEVEAKRLEQDRRVRQPPTSLPDVSNRPAASADLGQQLCEVSAAIASLRIEMGPFPEIAVPTSAAWKEQRGGGAAVLGLDFGTAFTKGVVRWKNKSFAVRWIDDNLAENPYLLPSVFSSHPQHGLVLGRKSGDGWFIHEGLKMRLLEPSSAIESDMAGAVLFIALALSVARDRFMEAHPAVIEAAPRWRLHLGLPADAWSASAHAERFTRIASAALQMCRAGLPCTQYNAEIALKSADTGAKSVSVMPEFACQIFSYLRSTRRQSDLHALVDVGAGTVDVAFFNVHSDESGDVLPIFAAAVECLGAHYLLAASAGRAGEKAVWKDRDSGRSAAFFADRNAEAEPDVADRRSLYARQLTALVNRCFLEARRMYPTSPVFWNGARMQIFMCGGGTNIELIRGRLSGLAKDAASRRSTRVAIDALPRPDDLEDYDGSAYDRLSVAYGLSHRAPDVGWIRRREEVDLYESKNELVAEDRDASR